MYSCGHKPKKIFLKKTDIVLYSIYQQWKKSDSNLCFNCWNEKRKKEFIELSLKVLNKNKLNLMRNE